jgi:hypothetical protein
MGCRCRKSQQIKRLREKQKQKLNALKKKENQRRKETLDHNKTDLA